MPDPVGFNVGLVLDNPNNAYGVGSSQSPTLDSATHEAEGGFGGGGDSAASVTDYGAVGDGITDDTAAVQAAADDNNCIYFPPGTYLVENLLVDDRETFCMSGAGAGRSTLKLRDDDGLGGTGQIINFTDVIKVKIHDLGFHGNYDNSKAGATAKPLVLYKTTVVSIGRKDCVWDVQRCRFEESAQGYGHCRANVYEAIDDDDTGEFEMVILRDLVSLYHGTQQGAFNIRGPAENVIIENIYIRNDGQYGAVTVGQASGVGSGKIAIGLSAQGAWFHFMRNVSIRNITTHGTYGSIFLGMCLNTTIDGVYEYESCTNHYYDTDPIPFTVNAANNTILTAVPAGGYGASSIVKFSTTGTLPDGLKSNVLYYVRTSGYSAAAFTVAETGQTGTQVDILDSGVGTHTIEWLGYSFANTIKCDDNLWYQSEPGAITINRVMTAKSTPHVGHSSLGVESSTGYLGEAVANDEVASRINITNCYFDSQASVSDMAPGVETFVSNCMFNAGWIPPITTGGVATGWVVSAVDAAANTITAVIPSNYNEIITEGDPITGRHSGTAFQFTTTGTLPGGLSLNTDYYPVGIVGDTFGLSTTIGGAPINLLDVGAGTHTIVPGRTASYGTRSMFNILGGVISDCIFGPQMGNLSMAPSDDLTFKNCRFYGGLIISQCINIVIQFFNNIWNIGDVGTATVQISPPVTVAAVAFTANPTDDRLTATKPSTAYGSSIVQLTTTGTLPAGLVTGTTYYVRDVSGSTFKLAATAGGAAIDITDAGVGTHSIQWFNKGTLRMVGNRIPAGAVYSTQLRITTGRDLTNFDVFFEDNDLTADTGGSSDYDHVDLRLTSVRNRNAARANSEYPRTTFPDSATPAITGGTNFLTVGPTAITNFTGGYEYQRIRVYIATGDQVNNTANIVTRSGANIVGPAVAEFIRFESVWREV